MGREWDRDWVTIPGACLSLLPQDMLVISQFQSANHYKEQKRHEWRNLKFSINSYKEQSISWLLPVITVLSHRIQGKGATAALKIIVRFSIIHFRTKLTQFPPVFSMVNEFTCRLIKGGKNSNRADAHGESWEDILSTATPCLSKPWISWGTKKVLEGTD